MALIVFLTGGRQYTDCRAHAGNTPNGLNQEYL